MSRPRFWRRPMDLDRWPTPAGEVRVIVERCKGCGVCVAFCPAAVLELSADLDDRGYHYAQVKPGRAAACLACGYCQSVCPDFAIRVDEVHP